MGGSAPRRTNGSESDLDLEPYLYGPIFEPIRRNRKLFSLVYVDPDTETLTWPNGADIDPDVLYYDGNPPWAVEEDSVTDAPSHAFA
ncbi:MAG: DUF2442 domain-containing protein [Chloroflexi bacterium]|nr:DUF2442 domain-containing protein [Chloroflexota bacterium]